MLTARSALAGDCRQVTVLFADRKGSMALLAQPRPAIRWCTKISPGHMASAKGGTRDRSSGFPGWLKACLFATGYETGRAQT